MILGLPAAQVVIGGAADRRWPLFAAVSWAAGGALVWWGWSRLRAAKADRPDLSWRQFLRDDLFALGIVIVLCAALAALPRTARRPDPVAAGLRPPAARRPGRALTRGGRAGARRPIRARYNTLGLRSTKKSEPIR
jgi:hypothetical protein